MSSTSPIGGGGEPQPDGGLRGALLLDGIHQLGVHRVNQRVAIGHAPRLPGGDLCWGVGGLLVRMPLADAVPTLSLIHI